MNIDRLHGAKLMNSLAPRFLNGHRFAKCVTESGVRIHWNDQPHDYRSEDTVALVGTQIWVCFNPQARETIAISARQDFSDFKLVPRVEPLVMES